MYTLDRAISGNLKHFVNDLFPMIPFLLYSFGPSDMTLILAIRRSMQATCSDLAPHQ